MKKIFILFISILLPFQLVGCTSIQNNDLSNLKSDNLFILKGLNYDMTFDDVVKTLEISKEDGLWVDSEDTSIPGRKYNHYVREGFKFYDNDCLLTLQFINDKLYGIAIGFNDENKDLKALYEKVKTELVNIYEEPIKLCEKTQADGGYLYEDTEWVSGSSKMLLGATYIDDKV